MIENLRLSHNSSSPDWGDPSLSQGFGGVFHGLAESEASSFAESTIANTLYTTDLSSATQYAITGENIQYRFPRYNNQNIANTVSSMTTTNQNIYSYGNYYNYYSNYYNYYSNYSNFYYSNYSNYYRDYYNRYYNYMKYGY